MSGERFYVVELAGIGELRGGYPTLTASVLDRAYSHREVARFTEPTGHIAKADRVQRVREQAAAEAARLNAWAACA